MSIISDLQRPVIKGCLKTEGAKDPLKKAVLFSLWPLPAYSQHLLRW